MPLIPFPRIAAVITRYRCRTTCRPRSRTPPDARHARAHPADTAATAAGLIVHKINGVKLNYVYAENTNEGIQDEPHVAIKHLVIRLLKSQVGQIECSGYYERGVSVESRRPRFEIVIRQLPGKEGEQAGREQHRPADEHLRYELRVGHVADNVQFNAVIRCRGCFEVVLDSGRYVNEPRDGEDRLYVG